MHTRISLGGPDWQFKDFIGEDWVWRNAHMPESRDTRGWRPASVPGSVQHDLLVLNEIPDPYFERNSLLCEWVPDRTWLYKRHFRIDEEHRNKRIQLCFEGVDYDAQFFLNGERIGSHRSMYTPACFEISDLLNFGEANLLVVVIEPAPHEQPQIGKTSLVRTLKSRMTYWWDFCPRMVHLGIWENVELIITEAARIEDVFVRPQLSEDLKRATINISTELSARQAVQVEVAIEISTTAHAQKKIVSSQRLPYKLEAGNTELQTTIELESPQLWWPNGHGEQPLYSAELRVVEQESGRESDQREVTFGIRRIEFAANYTPDPTARPYTLVVNGIKTFIKGWNWVPIDVMYGVEQPEKLERLLTLAKQANVNMLRVWGGGLIEREAFYNLCDRLGILVWQEFIQSSSGIDNNVADDPAYIDMLVREAEKIIPRKRNHPSLAIWCGGNELQGGPERPLDDSHPALAALHEIVERLDPDRLWLPTSPSGPVFSNSLENIEHDPLSQHDVHGPWEHQGLIGQYTLYNRSTSLLHSEFGAEGLTNLKTLQKVLSENNRWPVTLDNPVWHHLGAWWVKEKQWVDSLGDVQSLETLVAGTQYLQAEGVRYALESARTRKYQNSGTFPWQFNEPFPMAACTSAVDYYARPKPLYYAVARAYEDLHISAKFAAQSCVGQNTFEANIYVVNDYVDTIEGATVEIKLIGVSGKTYASQTATLTIRGNAAANVTAFSCPLAEVEEVFLLDLWLWTPLMISSQNRYLFTRAANLAPALATPETTLEVRRNDTSGFVTVTNTGSYVAMFVWLDDDRAPDAVGYVYFDDNHLCILPGESRSIAVAWKDVPQAERKLSVKAWNTTAYFV